MKSQDLIFIVIVVCLFFLKKGKYLHAAGLVALAAAGLLFLSGNLFTSQRLSWYGGAFLIGALLFELVKVAIKNVPKN